MAAGGVTIELKVIPNAPRNEVAGWRGRELTVKLTAPPLDGRANRQLCEFLAGVFGVSITDLTLLRGEKSRHKLIHVEGLTAAEARDRLNSHLR